MRPGDVFRSLNKAVILREMSAKMSDLPGDAPGEAKPENQRIHRNGASAKTAISG
jgi:transposase-like protein